MNCNQASCGRFLFFFLSYFYIFPDSCIWSFLEKQSVRLRTLLVFLWHLWAGSDFPLLLLLASCFTFPNVCIAAVLNTWEPSQNSSSKSAPLTSLELFFHCWYRSRNLYRLCTHWKERAELLYIYLNSAINVLLPSFFVKTHFIIKLSLGADFWTVHFHTCSCFLEWFYN